MAVKKLDLITLWCHLVCTLATDMQGDGTCTSSASAEASAGKHAMLQRLEQHSPLAAVRNFEDAPVCLTNVAYEDASIVYESDQVVAPEDCNNDCLEYYSDCTHFDFGNGKCTLRSSDGGGAMPQTGGFYFSGPKGCLGHHRCVVATSYPNGHIVKSFATTTIHDCRSACVDKNTCAFWAIGGGTCNLYSTDGGGAVAAANDYYSGTKYCFFSLPVAAVPPTTVAPVANPFLPDYTLVGKGVCADEDVKSEYNRLGWAPCTCGKATGSICTVGSCPTKETCATECDADADCAAFSWYQGHCWLYAHITKPYVDSNNKEFNWYQCYIKSAVTTTGPIR
mmetsp:Transcript_57083/g.107566  ORF Transcript_57083/g.107566 Transcript_57083/m.107566 type:complete len:337 (-) Transcript_57083:21-1031(-)